MKTLILDIETSPKIAYVWRFFKENIGAKQVKEHGHIMSFAAKWLDNDTVFYCENRKEDDTKIVQELCKFLDEADIVVAHNGQEFDLKQIRARALVRGQRPPSPVKIVDTYRIAKREFGFPSNSLEYLTNVLGCTIKKKSHKKFPGFELWLECLRNNEEAWAEMKAYNVDDVLALEELYLKMRPWDTKHPSVSVDSVPDQPVCPKCGSVHIQRRGFAYTNVGKFQRFACSDCGGWSRTRYSESGKNVNQLAPLVS